MNVTATGPSTLRLPIGIATALVILLAGLGALPDSPARAAVAAAAPDPALLGTAQEYAAGSCWEIKQVRPAAPDGAYWVVTPQMVEPQQVYCDQTTDGGGWVLVGKGRNGWTLDDSGTGNPAALLNTGYAGGADTHQYSTKLINGLLNGGAPVNLAEGVRLRRAMDVAGTSWQEVRFRPNTRQTGWSWAFPARFSINSWSFSPGSTGVTGTTSSGFGGSSDYFGTGTSWARVRSVPTELRGYQDGYGYGDSITGTNAAGSHLFSATNGGGGAIPVTQVYLRPRVLSTDAGFTALPDTGTPEAELRALHSSNADSLPWGVSGTAGSTTREGSVQVQAFAEAAGRMYVGGNFRYVEQGGGARTEQPFLAAFDLQSGQWISSFRPSINEQVRALEVLPNGSIVAGGDFTQANGQPATGVVALNPVTGATDTGFRLTVENRATGGMVRIWEFQMIGNQLYLGGDFTHLAGGGRTAFSYMRALARVRATDGRNENGWNPEMMGTVIDLDDSDDGSRIYASGFFNTSRGVATRKAAAVLTEFVTNPDGTVRHLADPLWAPVWSSTNKDYQQAIVEGGGNVWSGGSEHNVFGFDRNTFARTSTTILHAKGDIQTFSTAGDVLYAGSHANNQFAYTDATTWSGAGPGGAPWTSAHTQHWVGAFDLVNGDALDDFAPDFSGIRSGIWASTVDSLGRLWTGGDLTGVRTTQGPNRFAGGFARFSPATRLHRRPPATSGWCPPTAPRSGSPGTASPTRAASTTRCCATTGRWR